MLIIRNLNLISVQSWTYLLRSVQKDDSVFGSRQQEWRYVEQTIILFGCYDDKRVILYSLQQLKTIMED